MNQVKDKCGIALEIEMLAFHPIQQGLLRAVHGAQEQPTIVIVAEPSLLVDCLVEVAQDRFPKHNVLALSETEALACTQHSNFDLILIFRRKTAEVDELFVKLEACNPPPLLCVVISSIGELEPRFIQMAGEQRIKGVLLQGMRLEVFLANMDLLLMGGEAFPSAVMERDLVPASRRTTSTSTDIEQAVDLNGGAVSGAGDPVLTIRENQVFALLRTGTPNKIIAHRLCLSENTVKVHIRNIYRKLGVTNRTAAALRFFESLEASQCPALNLSEDRD